jgi:hypothetical protein
MISSYWLVILALVSAFTAADLRNVEKKGDFQKKTTFQS